MRYTNDSQGRLRPAHPGVRTRMAAGLLLAICLAACAAPMRSGSHCALPEGALDDDTAMFWPGMQVLLEDSTGYISPTITDALARAVARELQAKAIRLDTDACSASRPRLELRIALRVRREVTSATNSSSPCDHTDCWERTNPGGTTTFNVATIGFLSADIYQDERPVWRGWVERALYPSDRDQAEEVLAQAVPALFKDYPP